MREVEIDNYEKQKCQQREHIHYPKKENKTKNNQHWYSYSW